MLLLSHSSLSCFIFPNFSFFKSHLSRFSSRISHPISHVSSPNPTSSHTGVRCVCGDRDMCVHGEGRRGDSRRVGGSACHQTPLPPPLSSLPSPHLLLQPPRVRTRPPSLNDSAPSVFSEITVLALASASNPGIPQPLPGQLGLVSASAAALHESFSCLRQVFGLVARKLSIQRMLPLKCCKISAMGPL